MEGNVCGEFKFDMRESISAILDFRFWIERTAVVAVVAGQSHTI